MTGEPTHPFAVQPFDEIVYDHEGKAVRQSFDEFMAIPLAKRVALLIDQEPTFIKNGEPIPREKAISLL